MGADCSHEKTFCLGSLLTDNKPQTTALANLPAKAVRPDVIGSILVIDSGVGGLSVCQSILARLPAIQIIYFADSEYFPYGVLPETELSQRLNVIVAKMLLLHKPSLVVLACNTVSTLMLPELRARFQIPFVGVVPAIKPAAQLSTQKCIGLLATPATVVRPYTDKLIADYAQDCEVVKVGSTELVFEAERYLSGYPVNQQVLESILQPFMEPLRGKTVDTIVLGCTHFPLLKQALESHLPGINWVDSGEAIAKRVQYLLEESAKANALSQESQDSLQLGAPAKHQFYFSKPPSSTEALSKAITLLGFANFEFHSF